MKYLGWVRLATYGILLWCIATAQRTGHLPVSLAAPNNEPPLLDVARFICLHTPYRGVGFQHTTMSGTALIQESSKVAEAKGISLSRYDHPTILLDQFSMRWSLEFAALDGTHAITITIDDRTREADLTRGMAKKA